MAREMHRSVDEVGAVVAEAGIDCGFHKGGALYFAVDAGQWRRVRQHHEELVRHGLGDVWTLLDAKAAAEPGELAIGDADHHRSISPTGRHQSVMAGASGGRHGPGGSAVASTVVGSCGSHAYAGVPS